MPSITPMWLFHANPLGCNLPTPADIDDSADRTTAESAAAASDHPIVFYDGVCGLCNRFVDFVMHRDRQGQFRFAPLQGETAAATLDEDDRQSLASVVLSVGNQSFRKSSAVVRVLWRLGGIWKVFATLMWLIPLPLRNLGYGLIARLRYRLFGKKEACRLPTPQERTRFLP